MCQETDIVTPPWTKEPTCKKLGAYCADVSKIAGACGEPEMRRNGLRISVEYSKTKN